MTHFKLILPVVALLAPLLSISATAVRAAGTAAPHFTASAEYYDADDKPVATVFAGQPDEQMHNAVVFIYGNMGAGYSRADRARIIANRLSIFCAKNPKFYENLSCATTNGYPVVAPKGAPRPTVPPDKLDELLTTPDFIVTADPDTLDGNDCKTDGEYAVYLQGVLSHILGAGTKDAKFDFQLQTQTEKTERARIYANLAETAVADKDYDRARACYTRALQLDDSCNNWKLKLAGLLVYYKGQLGALDTTSKYNRPADLLASLTNPTPDELKTAQEIKAKIR